MANNPANDVKLAKDALLYFYNRALRYPENFPYDWDSFLTEVQDRYPSFLPLFGGAIRDSGVSDMDLQSYMESIADQGQGKLPRQGRYFFQPLVDGSAVTTWKEIKITFAEAPKALGEAAAAVGKVSLETLSNAGALVKYVPFVLFGALCLYAFHKARA